MLSLTPSELDGSRANAILISVDMFDMEIPSKIPEKHTKKTVGSTCDQFLASNRDIEKPRLEQKWIRL